MRAAGTTILLALSLLSPTLAAQNLASGPSVADPGELSYETRFDEVMGMDGVHGGVAEVTSLELKRDVGRIALTSGKLYLLTQVGGRTIGAVFLGTGTFSFAPPTAVEQERLARFEKRKTLETPFTDLVLLFADSTEAELRAKLKFGTARIPREVRDRVKDGLKYLSDEDAKSFDPDLMCAFLNGERSDLFYAHFRRPGADPLMFMLDPHKVEAVSLESRPPRRAWAREPELISQFPRNGATRDLQATGERSDQAEIRRYTMDIRLPPSGIGDLGFKAAAKLEITTRTPVGPWVAFELFDKLQVDSARWEGGDPAIVYKGHESSLLWVRLDRRLQPAETRNLNLWYHGDLIDRWVDFFTIKSSIAWYPLSLEGRTLADFDLTFHTTDAYVLASVGERVDSSVSAGMVRTRWVSQGPIRNASFNLGLFKDYTVREAGLPLVTVLFSEEAHRKLARVYVQQRKMRETVGADVAKSLQFFQNVYGPTRVKHFYATEIPEFHGEAFPGLVHLSWTTFQLTDHQGEDDIFRAHEVAHQWWGIGVDYMTYHDRWLSEGFSDFSGLWYMQTSRHDNDKYFGMLRRWRADILVRKGDAGPISLGHRVWTSNDDRDYQIIVYRKGAWVLHMLRILMLDLNTMSDDRFTETMRDFYRSYEGKRASTADFRRIVERHTGADMGWFFRQWIDSSAIPSYRVAYRSEPAEGGQFRVRLRVHQENVPDDFQMYVPVTLDLGQGRVARVRVKIKGPRSEVDLPLMPASPKSLKFNDLEGVLAEVKMVDWKD